MWKRPRGRFARAITRALLKRDRLEIQIVDALLSMAAPKKLRATRRRQGSHATAPVLAYPPNWQPR